MTAIQYTIIKYAEKCRLLNEYAYHFTTTILHKVAVINAFLLQRSIPMQI